MLSHGSRIGFSSVQEALHLPANKMRGEGGMGEGAGVSRESRLDANWIFERLERVNPFSQTKCGERGEWGRELG